MPKINSSVILVFIIFFVISFMTNIMGTLLPIIVATYHLSNGIAAFMPFSFFVAYGVLSLPAGVIFEKIGTKRMLALAFLLIIAGSGICSLSPSFPIVLLSSFLIGCAMAILQVVINPLLRESGGENNFAFNSVVAQVFFGLASYVAPLFFSFLIQNSKNTTDSMNWLSLYKSFFVIGLVMLVIVFLFPMPKTVIKEDEKVNLSKSILSSVLSNKTVWFYFLGVFCYVGLEQGVSTWISTFLWKKYQVDPALEGARVNAYFWGLMTIGCVLGLFLLKKIDSKRVLTLFCFGAGAMLLLALFGGNKTLSIFCFPMVGFFLSVMYSIVFSLGLNSVSQNHGTVSGVLCSGIFGGAVIPLCIGWLSYVVPIGYAMLLNFLLLGFLLIVALRPVMKATQ